ncbi:hypothetical protein [Chlamydia pecorum]|uniref:hypothetical protein n=1 Tax=Chlamydia pecorum TaxID=85991 RepID=UPI0003AE141B|nr:hypothetical protein [Chlamydia pecorum]AGW39821.1 hypothetical protein CPE3_0479 [Chlamydia pecorum P787]
MSFFNLQSVNDKLRPVSLDHFVNTEDWKALANLLSSDKEFRNPLLPEYQVRLQIRVALLVLGILSILSLIFISLRNLKSHVATLTWPAIVLTVLIPSVLLIGGLAVFYCLGKKIDIFAGTKIDPFGKRCLVPTNLFWQKYTSKDFFSPSSDMECYTDLSTLDASGSGVALVYLYPKVVENRVPMFVFPLIGIPMFVLGRMIYNIIRSVVIPFYILLRMLIERCLHKEIRKEERFIFSDIFRETFRSLWNVIKAPFYGSAYYMALFYGLLNPLAGRIAISCLERDWNDDIIRSRSLWLISPQRYFSFEGGGRRSGLAQHAFYSMGCFQPFALLSFKNGEVVSGGRTSLQYLKPLPPVVAFLQK